MHNSLPSRSTSRSFTVLATTFMLYACAELPAAVEPTEASRAISIGSSDIRPAERHLHVLAQEFPGFGGYFIDDSGVLVAYMTSTGRDDVLRSRLQALVATDFMAVQTQRVDVRRGEFDFPSLARWRDIVSRELIAVVPGVVFSDADEATNRVAIGIDEGSHRNVRADVLRALEVLDVPLKAVSLVAAHAASPDVADPEFSVAATAMSADQDLLGVPNPIVAGYRVFAPGPCTLGPVVRHNGHTAALTNSHCTSTTYAFDGSQLRTSDWMPIGQEMFDPGPTCGSMCRRTDAALMYVNANVPHGLGLIARTTNTSSTWGVDGSLEVSQAYPTRDVVGYVGSSYILPGMSIYKTGAATGTTSGVIQSTCIDALGTDGFLRKCSLRSTYYSAGGDSGSPVYAMVPNTGGNEVSLVGIHWGGDRAHQRTFSSSIHEVIAEIPGLYTVARPTPPMPLDVYITGASDVNNSPMCRLRYEANASGGSGSYTYTWSTNGEIKEEYDNVIFAAFPPDPGLGDARFVEVTVTDGLGGNVTYQFGVTTSSHYDMCYT